MNLTERSFTLLELILVVILIGVMAGYGVPSYQRAIEKNEERVAIAKLQAIGAGITIYKAKHGGYPAFDMPDIASINSNLQLNIMPDTLTYQCSNSYQCSQNPGFDSTVCQVTSPNGWILHWHEPIPGGLTNAIHCSVLGSSPCPACPYEAGGGC